LRLSGSVALLGFADWLRSDEPDQNAPSLMGLVSEEERHGG